MKDNIEKLSRIAGIAETVYKSLLGFAAGIIIGKFIGEIFDKIF